MKMKSKDYRIQIRELDKIIAYERDVNKKLAFIDKDVILNKQYLDKLLKHRKARVFWCVVLSFLCGLGLAIFLPIIITKKRRARRCVQRLRALAILRDKLVAGGK